MQETFVGRLRGACAVLPGSHVLVAVSGGADTYPIPVSCAHVEHGIRGAASEGDMRFVKTLCEQKNVPFYGGRVDAPGYARAHGCGLEEAARALRYDFLDAMDEVSALEPVIPDMTQASSVSRTEIQLAASLASLRSGTLATLAEAARRAPEVVTITPACVLPSLALCYRQSGGVDLEADLVARNRLIHPGFVPVEPLEVLRG